MKPSKSESRIERQNRKALKDKEKSARLSSSIEIPQKYIRTTEMPAFEKTPRSVDPDNYKDTMFSWSENNADRDDAWSWGENRDWSQEEFDDDIKSHLDSLNNLAWHEVETLTYNGAGKYRKRLNKYQNVESLCDEALGRWIDELEMADFEETFRLRSGSDRRIWGVRISHHFYLIWYERNHKICPVS